MKLCEWCREAPTSSEHATYCADEECARERAYWRKVKQRDRQRYREWLGWQQHRDRNPVEMNVIEGEGERIAMTGSHTARCECGLLLRAETEPKLGKLRERHEAEVCLARRKTSHWSVFTAARQRRRPTWRGRGDRDKLDRPGPRAPRRKRPEVPLPVRWRRDAALRVLDGEA